MAEDSKSERRMLTDALLEHLIKMLKNKHR